MIEIIGVKFNGAGKAYYFDPKGIQLENGASVLVETARGVEMGKVVIPNKMVEESEIVSPLKTIIREATEEDMRQVEENKAKEKEAFNLAVQKIAEHKLEMKLVGAEYTFDRSKILFYFTADGRVDFRDLVKSLASVFRTRIELRQIGVRDEARQIGSLGICGRSLCCSTFLNDFHPVSIKMAKEQGLSLNPTKISGVCGRLMCCLQYEQNAYEDMLAKLPRRGDTVETPDGVGTVVETATLKGRIKVKFPNEQGDGFKFDTYVMGDIQASGKGGRMRLERPEEQGEEVSEFTEPISITQEAASTAEGDRTEQQGEQAKRKRRRRRGGKKSGGAGQNTPADGAEKQKQPSQKKTAERKPQKPQGAPESKSSKQGASESRGNGGYSNNY